MRNFNPISSNVSPRNRRGIPRRGFLSTATKAAAVSALAGVTLPHVHAAQDSTIQMALIGCGGRGSGAAADALRSTTGPTKLVAMADLFEDRLTTAHRNLSQAFGERADVPPDHRFVGFDAYRHAIDSLRPGSVVLQCTHAAFRAQHLEYAISKGMHVFMEKTFAADPVGIRRILKAGEAAAAKGLKIGCGLMCRHSSARQALIEKIRRGELGDIHLIRAYRMDSGYLMGPYNGRDNELLWQIRRPYQFYWASSGIFLELMIHQIDECCWIKDAWPVSAHGVGGRAPGVADASQNLHSYAIEYTFADGAKAFVTGRYLPKCHSDFSTFLHGTRAAAQFSGDIHAPTVRVFKDQRIAGDNVAWRPEKETKSPYQAEWDALLTAVREDRPHNEVQRAAYSNLAAIMGRAAVNMGRIITWEEALNSNFSFYPDVDKLTADSPAPVRANAQGFYPVPVPGVWSEI
jgi:predicted dehydrogenase